MNEIEIVSEALSVLIQRGKGSALATVVAVKGSSYRRPGARMLVSEDSDTTGSVSGGCLEADVVERALLAIASGRAEVATYDMADEGGDALGLGVGCNGSIDILIEPLSGDRDGGLAIARALQGLERGGVLATVYAGTPVGDRLSLGGDGTVSTTLSGDVAHLIADKARRALDIRTSRNETVEIGASMLEVFLEYVAPPLPLVIFGAGPDAGPLTAMAKAAGWSVTIVDHRPAYARRDRFPQADAVVLARPEEARSLVRLSDTTAAVIATHNFMSDRVLLAELLTTPVGYIGLLGSRGRTARLIAELRDGGQALSDQDRRRLHGPTGLDIGADNPQTIALSIVAEIQGWAAGRSGGFLRDSARSIRNHPDQAEGAIRRPEGARTRCRLSA